MTDCKRIPLYLMLIARLALAQSTGATFGDVIRLGGTPSDIVLDKSRGRLYLVPGVHLKGDQLPVTISLGGVSSPTTGSNLPYVALN